MDDENGSECATESAEFDLVSMITDILKEGELSISALTRKLEVQRGSKLHRLEVTGCLKAMASLGLLDSKRIPPSLVFSLKEGGHDR